MTDIDFSAEPADVDAESPPAAVPGDPQPGDEEPVEPEEVAEEVEDVIPPSATDLPEEFLAKFAGKSDEEKLRAHYELEKKLGEQGRRISELTRQSEQPMTATPTPDVAAPTGPPQYGLTPEEQGQAIYDAALAEYAPYRSVNGDDEEEWTRVYNAKRVELAPQFRIQALEQRMEHLLEVAAGPQAMNNIIAQHVTPKDGVTVDEVRAELLRAYPGTTFNQLQGLAPAFREQTLSVVKRAARTDKLEALLAKGAVTQPRTQSQAAPVLTAGDSRGSGVAAPVTEPQHRGTTAWQESYTKHRALFAGNMTDVEIRELADQNYRDMLGGQ